VKIILLKIHFFIRTQSSFLLKI